MPAYDNTTTSQTRCVTEYGSTITQESLPSDGNSHTITGPLVRGLIVLREDYMTIHVPLTLSRSDGPSEPLHGFNEM